MEDKDIYFLSIMKKCQAVLEGHFLLSSGLHSNKYFQCAQLFQYPDESAKLMQELATKIPHQVDVVIGPALGGIIMAYELARFLKARAIFAEREGLEMRLRRNFHINHGEKVIVAEDVVTTGKSTMEVIKIVENLGGDIKGITCVIDRRNPEIKLLFPVYSLIKIEVETYKPEECPLCLLGSSAVKPGSRGI
ncbi:MAG: Orotate phosphoribosyltransferase [candidate division WS2 bacterium]|nr:Orotate phosphoribosyltransferase [Candidatus Lithacetigena glycinireducens]MBT9174652.1 Orotate phosphoribosyltransferase [Candidatus Lithacetigena glycinireducens]